MTASTEPGGPPKGESAAPAGESHTIGHGEFDPLGTFVLIILYFLVLIALWLFTYFIEFVPNDPTPLIVCW